MRTPKEIEKGVRFANSERGRYLISQALFVAINVMDQEKSIERREDSNILDMRFLLDNVFPTYKIIQSIIDANPAPTHRRKGDRS